MAIKFPKVSDFKGVDSSGKKLIPEEFETGKVLQDWSSRPLPAVFQRLDWIAGDYNDTPHLDVGLWTYGPDPTHGNLQYYLAADFEFTFDGMLFGKDRPDTVMQVIGCLRVDNSGGDTRLGVPVLGCYFGARLHYSEPAGEGEPDTPPYICPIFCYGKNEVELEYYQIQMVDNGDEVAGDNGEVSIGNWRAVDPKGYHRLRLDMTGMVLDGELLFPDEGITDLNQRRAKMPFQILGATFIDKDSGVSAYRAAHLPVRSIRLWKRYLTTAWGSYLPDAAGWPNYKPHKFVEGNESRRPVLAYDLVPCSNAGNVGMYDYANDTFRDMDRLHVGPAYAEQKTVAKFVHWEDDLHQVYLPGDFSTSKTLLSNNTISAVYGDQTLAHYIVPCDGDAIDIGSDGRFDEGAFSGLDPVHTGKVEIDPDVGEIIHLGPWEYLTFGKNPDRIIDPFAGDSITIMGWFKPNQKGDIECRYNVTTKELSVTHVPSNYGGTSPGGWGWYFFAGQLRGESVREEEGIMNTNGDHYLNGDPWYCIINTNPVFAGFASTEWSVNPPSYSAINHEACEFLNIAMVNMNGGFVKADLPNLVAPRWDSVYDCINSSGRLVNAVGTPTKQATVNAFEKIQNHWTFIAASFCPTTKTRFGYIRNENGAFLSTLASETTILDTRDVCRSNFGNPLFNYMPPRYMAELLKADRLRMPGSETNPPAPGTDNIISGRSCCDMKYKYLKVLRRAATIQEVEETYAREKEFFYGQRSATPGEATAAKKATGARKSAPRRKKAVKVDEK